jgi:hypothetical protein
MRVWGVFGAGRSQALRGAFAQACALSALVACTWGARETWASSDVLYVLDASSSMARPTREGGAPLFDRAIHILHGEVSGASLSGKAVGLVVFGHRHGNCDDIELVAPISAGSPSQIHSFLNTVLPKGSTPLAGALRLANEALKNARKGTKVVVLSDGIETCKGDAVGEARNLVSAHPDSSVDVHYFKLGNDLVPPQLSAIASSGNGYLRVFQYEAIVGSYKSPSYRSNRGRGSRVFSPPSRWDSRSAHVPGALYDVTIRAPQLAPPVAEQAGDPEGPDAPQVSTAALPSVITFNSLVPPKPAPAPSPILPMPLTLPKSEQKKPPQPQQPPAVNPTGETPIEAGGTLF